jgi:hypothetical protein
VPLLPLRHHQGQPKPLQRLQQVLEVLETLQALETVRFKLRRTKMATVVVVMVCSAFEAGTIRSRVWKDVEAALSTVWGLRLRPFTAAWQ